MKRASVLFGIVATCAVSAFAGDLNGDGFAELVVGAPQAKLDGLGGPADGVVYLIPGSALLGLDVMNELTIRPSDCGIAPNVSPTQAVNFGLAIALGNFDGDEYDDLAIGAPGATVDGNPGGVVVVLYGTQFGVIPSDAEIWSQNTPGIQDKAEHWPGSGDIHTTFEEFGKSLVTGDFNGDGFDDLAIGVAEKVGSTVDAGGVHVIYGGPHGLSAKHDRLWTQNSSGVKGKAEVGEEFGSVLAAADFDQDGFDELVIGTPFETIGKSPIGVVQVLRGSAKGLTSHGNQLLKPPNFKSESLTEAEFGVALAVGDFDGDTFPDLAVSNPTETSVQNPALTGSIWIYHGGAGGLVKHGATRLTQEGLGLTLTAAHDFGRGLAGGDFDGDGFSELAIGEPHQLSSPGVTGGGVFVLKGAATLSGVGATFWSQDSSGIIGVGANGEAFGSVLATANVNGDECPELLVGAPFDANDSDGFGSVLCLYGVKDTGLVSTSNTLLGTDTFLDPPGFQGPANFGNAIGR